MIGVSPKPSSSSAARIAPTRPSIMSLGATTSAPARAWETAVRASSSSDASLSTVPSAVSTPAVAVVGVLAQADVGDHEQLGVRGLDRARGELHDALVVPGAGALGVLLGGDAEQQHGGDAEREGAAGLLDGRRRCRGGRRPGIEAIGARPSRPSSTNSGRTRSDGCERGLAHEVAQRAGAAQAAQARARERRASHVQRRVSRRSRSPRRARARLPVLERHREDVVVLPAPVDVEVLQRAALAGGSRPSRRRGSSGCCAG